MCKNIISNTTIINITGGIGGLVEASYRTGGFGGASVGIYCINSSNNIINNISINKIIGGKGGEINTDLNCKGGNGGPCQQILRWSSWHEDRLWSCRGITINRVPAPG